MDALQIHYCNQVYGIEIMIKIICLAFQFTRNLTLLLKYHVLLILVIDIDRHLLAMP